MANQEYLTQLARGLEYWNQWRNQNPRIRPDLSGADFSGMNFRGISLGEANLSGANLSEANLEGANLRRSNLAEANLNRADLTGTNLSGASLNKAILIGANLSGTFLNRANLSKATVGDTIFARVDLRTIKGLAELRHWSPSRVVLHTLQLPQDDSAFHFLRGAGVPEEWIALYSATMMSPIQYYSCFLCYARQDETLARRLHADLQDQGVRCWFAPEETIIGNEESIRIDGTLHMQEKRLLLLSKHSLESAWVIGEIKAALEKEIRQRRPILFLACIDKSVMDTSRVWAAKLHRTCYIADFTRWVNPQEYQHAFERLLRDLKRADELLRA